jgi:hypothetical protein
MEGHRQEKERKFPKKVIKGEKSRDFLRHRQNSLVKGKKVRMDGRNVPYIGIKGMKKEDESDVPRENRGERCDYSLRKSSQPALLFQQ